MKNSASPKPEKTKETTPAPAIIPQTGTRCRFCGIEGHTASTCALREAADRELATEAGRRQRLGIDYLGGVRIDIRRAA